MLKDFDKWNTVKTKTDLRNNNPRVKIGDVYWCKLGINIGTEQDGKNESFNRPVVIIRKFSKDLIFILPLTTQVHKGSWYFDITIKNISAQVMLNQGKAIDVKRLEKFILNLSENKTDKITQAFVNLIINKS